MLELESPRWAELATRCGRADWVPGRLREIIADPADVALLDDTWPALSSEGTTWSAAFAVVPYLREVAAQLPPAERIPHLIYLGMTVICDSSKEQGVDGQLACPADLRPAYEMATHACLSLIPESLLEAPTEEEVLYLLAAQAAFLGHSHLGEVLAHLDSGCQSCGAPLF